MVLQLGEGHTEFYGTNKGQMPLLIKAGLVPMNVAQLMQRRVAVLSDEALKAAFWNNYFDTGDAVAYKDDKVKIVLDAQPLREMNARSELSNGALILPDGMYETLQGQEFIRKELKELTGKVLSQTAARENPLWQVVAREQAVLDVYADAVFREGKTRYNYDENMGFYVADAQKQPTMRALYVGSLNSRSNALGNFDLDYDNGRLVGVAPEARVGAERLAPKKSGAVFSVESENVVRSLDDVLGVLKQYITPENEEAVRRDLTALYQKK